MPPIIRDWTNKTITVDLVNSLGEKYHFEIEPNITRKEADSAPTRPTSGPDEKDNHGARWVQAEFPIA
jgi:hypothetical protein